MFKRFAAALGTVVLTAAVAAPDAAAQMWDTPSFLAPRPADDIGVYAFRGERVSAFGDDSDWGFAAIWRQSGNINLGVRAGIASAGGTRLVLVGAELIQPLDLFGPGSPVDVAGTVGIGATINGVTTLRIPLGVTAGFTIPLGGMMLTPFVHPRVTFDLSAFDVGDREETETDFRLPVDLGAELLIGESFLVRLGASLDQRNMFGAGIALRTPRRVVVR